MAGATPSPWALPLEPCRVRFTGHSLVALSLRVIVKHPRSALSKERQAVLLAALSAASGRQRQTRSAVELVSRALAHSKQWADETLLPGLIAHLRAWSLANSRSSPAGTLRCLSEAPSASRLEALDLTGMHALSDTQLKDLTMLLPQLRCLSVVNCRRISGAGLRHLTANCKHLRNLDIGGCFNITAEDLGSWLREQPCLEEFSCLGLGGVAADEAALRVVEQRCRSLVRLSVSFNTAADDSAIARIVAGSPLLTHFTGAWCGAMGDATVAALAASCPLLYSVDLTGVKGVGAEAIQALVARRAAPLSVLRAAGASSSASVGSLDSRAGGAGSIGGGSSGVGGREQVGGFDGDVTGHAASRAFALDAEDWAEVLLEADRLLEEGRAARRLAGGGAGKVGSAAATAAGAAAATTLRIGPLGRASSDPEVAGGTAVYKASFLAGAPITPHSRFLRCLHLRYTGSLGRAAADYAAKAGLAVYVHA